MLDTLRNSTSSWAVRIMIGLLVVSFGVWGITDVFSYRLDETIVQVDDTEIGLQQYRVRAIQELAILSEEEGERIDFETAREDGADQTILDTLIDRALLDNTARQMGLRVGKEQVIERILEAPEFRNAFGEFDRSRFEQLLRANGLNEELYLESQRSLMERQQILAAVREGAYVPFRLAELLHLYVGEKRISNYFIFGIEALDEIEDPGEDELRALYNEDPERFNDRERRDFQILMLEPRHLKDNAEVSEEEIKEEYELRKEEYDIPERRRVEQLSFASPEEANTALDRLEGGEDFHALAAERGFEPEELELGFLTRDEFDIDSVGEAAFQLEEVDDVSEVVDGPLGSVILRVTEITPGKKSTFEDARDRVLFELQFAQASEEVISFYDVVEDERAAGKSLVEVAEELELELLEFEGIAKNSRGRDGERPEDLPYINGLMQAIYEISPGEEALAGETTGGGFYWFDVLEVIEEHTPDFEEARDRIKEEWIKDTQKELLQARVEDMIFQFENETATMEEVVVELPHRKPRHDKEEEAVTVKITEPITRNKRGGDYRKAFVERMFEIEPGEYSWVWGRREEEVFVFQLDDIQPAIATEEIEEITDLLDQLTAGMRNDIVTLLVDGLRANAEITVNEELLASPVVDPYYQGY